MTRLATPASEGFYVKPLLSRSWRAATARRQVMPLRGSLTLGPVGPTLDCAVSERG